MSAVAIPRNMSKACRLYLQRSYDEADKIMAKISEPHRQKMAVEAQLALFRWEHDTAIAKCMEFLPYLNEWRSLNMLEAAFAMITFSAQYAGKNEVIEYLGNLKDQFEGEADERYKRFVIGNITRSLTYLNGENTTEELPQQENLMTVKEAAEKWGCSETDSAESACKILGLGYGKIDPNEYIELYERYHDLPTLMEFTRANAIKSYLYLGRTEKIAEAVLDLYRHTWQPVEKTTVMPISILTYDKNLWQFYTKELFDKIYTTAAVHFE